MQNPVYTYILNTWCGLVWIYGVSTIVGYLMPSSVYIYIYIVMIINRYILYIYI